MAFSWFWDHEGESVLVPWDGVVEEAISVKKIVCVVFSFIKEYGNVILGRNKKNDEKKVPRVIKVL